MIRVLEDEFFFLKTMIVEGLISETALNEYFKAKQPLATEQQSLMNEKALMLAVLNDKFQKTFKKELFQFCEEREEYELIKSINIKLIK